MSPRDFDRQVGVYLDGEATRVQVHAIRRALREQPELKSRLAALVRLHRAQSAALNRRSRPSLALVLSQLRALADRAGRFLAHACILVLVCVELDVAFPRVDSQSWVNGGRPLPAAASAEVAAALPVPDLPVSDMMPMDRDLSDPMGPEGTFMMPAIGSMPSSASSLPVASDHETLAGG
jgi:hypothetical protein